MSRLKKWLPWLCLALFATPLVAHLKGPANRTPFDVAGFSGLPALSGGRVKPLDTIARTSLLMLRGKQSLRFEKRTLAAREWLLDMLFRPEVANRYPAIEINDPDVLGLMGIQQDKKRHFSFDELAPHLPAIAMQAAQADAVKPEQRNRFQGAILTLHSRLILYQKLQNTLQLSGESDMAAQFEHFIGKIGPLMLRHMSAGARGSSKDMKTLSESLQKYQFIAEVAEFMPLPGARGMKKDDWVSVGQGLLDAMSNPSPNPGLLAYAKLGDAWRAQDPAAFNAALTEYRVWLSNRPEVPHRHVRTELIFNHSEPFYQSMVIYVAVMLLVFGSWLAWETPLRRSANTLLVLAFCVHTIGLFARMWIQGRPPVTNLYSSAIFVGWAAVGMGIYVERFYRNGLSALAASVIGLITLIVAHHLNTQGDTLEMMRAVLDSNFWLATHVITITIGYSSTFLSGALAAAFLIRRVFDRSWTTTAATHLDRMVYGIVCFNLLMSFIGTILGGIWADQSWGRFWGWDPKENGALMIVLWNAFILHARIGGIAGPVALMMMAVFGNVVTTFSWFGVNMLGIGLHSYGFMDKAFFWLMLFSLTQFAIIALGFLPERRHKQS